MEHKKIVVVSKQLADAIDKYTNRPGEEDYLDENETITQTARFDDGFTADIKCCGVQWDESVRDNSAWTEGILYNTEGRQVAFTEPDDNFWGIWDFRLENGDKYIVDIRKAG